VITGTGVGAVSFLLAVVFGCRSWRTLRRGSRAGVAAETTQTVVGRALFPAPITPEFKE
jgi:hypothetical protein